MFKSIGWYFKKLISFHNWLYFFNVKCLVKVKLETLWKYAYHTFVLSHIIKFSFKTTPVLKKLLGKFIDKMSWFSKIKAYKDQILFVIFSLFMYIFDIATDVNQATEYAL